MDSVKFQELILPHLDAAYNYAFWLARNPHDAEDLTQESFSRALAAFHGFKNTNPRAWLLTIVRHTFFNQEKQRSRQADIIYLDALSNGPEHPALHSHDTPELLFIRHTDASWLHKAMNQLPAEFREIIVLRELEGFSYDELATILDCAMGTVMSRLARAREKLKSIMHEHENTVETGA